MNHCPHPHKYIVLLFHPKQGDTCARKPGVVRRENNEKLLVRYEEKDNSGTEFTRTEDDNFVAYNF